MKDSRTLRHGGAGARTAVLFDWQDDGLVVSVTDDGRGDRAADTTALSGSATGNETLLTLLEGISGAALSQAAALLHVSHTEQWLREHLRSTDSGTAPRQQVSPATGSHS